MLSDDVNDDYKYFVFYKYKKPNLKNSIHILFFFIFLTNIKSELISNLMIHFINSFFIFISGQHGQRGTTLWIILYELFNQTKTL